MKKLKQLVDIMKVGKLSKVDADVYLVVGPRLVSSPLKHLDFVLVC